MKVIVTGANGMLGQDLCPILENYGYEVIKTDKYNLDITNLEDCKKTLSENNPELIIHCAAYTDVNNAEIDIQKATEINIKGTENIAQIASKIGATLIYISTDYVFDGETKQPYTVDDKPNPINVYGQTKLKGEEVVKNLCKNFYIIRTSWLYGLNGNNFVKTMLSLANEDKRISVVDDQFGCPTWTIDLAHSIIKIINNKDFGTYHVCGSGYTSWYGFAEEIFAIKNLKPNLIPCKTNEYQSSVKRPSYSVLANDGICRDWKIALNDFLTNSKSSNLS